MGEPQLGGPQVEDAVLEAGVHHDVAQENATQDVHAHGRRRDLEVGSGQRGEHRAAQLLGFPGEGEGRQQQHRQQHGQAGENLEASAFFHAGSREAGSQPSAARAAGHSAGISASTCRWVSSLHSIRVSGRPRSTR